MIRENPHENSPVVLVVEDEFFVREEAVWVLAEHGFEVLEAPNGAAALEVLAARPDVGIVFTDVFMPGEVDGLDLARIVGRRWPHIRVAVTSGRPARPEEWSPDSGCFIPKPYAPEVVVRRLAALLDGRPAAVGQNGVRLRTAAASVPSSR